MATELIKPDSLKAFTLASDLLKELDTLCLKTPLNAIIYDYDIKLLPFSELKNSIPNSSTIYKTSGFLVNFSNIYHICYQDNDDICKLRWTLAHELGHYFFDHPMLNQDSYDVYEAEANYFASQLLMPIELIIMLDQYYNVTEPLLSSICNVSAQASKYRINYYKKNYFANFELNQDLMYDYHILIRKFKRTDKIFQCLRKTTTIP